MNDIVGHVITETTRGRGLLGAALAATMMHPATGMPLLGLLLCGMYVVLGQWIAGGVVGITEGTLMQGYWEPFVRGSSARSFAAGLARSTRSSPASSAC